MKFTGFSEKEFEKNIEEKSNEKIVEELNKKLKGKNFSLYGYVKENSFTGQNNFIVKEVIL